MAIRAFGPGQADHIHATWPTLIASGSAARITSATSGTQIQLENLGLIRPITADDFEALFAVASDPLIWKVHPAHDRWQEPVFRKYFDDGLASNGAVVFIDRATDAIIGASRYESEREPIEPGEVEIGWTFIARAYWGGAWNRSVKRLMIQHAFDAGYTAALFLVGEDNIRSRRAMEKIGGTLSDRTSMAQTGGKMVRHVVYEIRPDDFATGPLS